MCSETITGTWLRPLCTEIVKPTKSGRIIERRDQVLIGLRLLAAIAASTLANKCASTNGPFFRERGIVRFLYLLLNETVANDQLSRTLIGTCLVPFSFLTPWAYRLNTFVTPFTTTVRMVNRVHCHTTNGRNNATPAQSISFTERTKVAFRVRYIN